MNVHEIIATNLIKEMESNPQWLKEWITVDNQNLISGKSYQGINRLLLGMSKQKNKFSSMYWLTYNQAIQKGGYIKSGSKSSMAIFWLSEWEKKNEHGDKEIIQMPVMRFYRLFNLDQTEGITAPEPEFKNNPIEQAEEIVKNYQEKPNIINASNAYYMPLDDHIGIPDINLFKTPEAYYSTLFHELTHSTGHKKRLDRDLQGSKLNGDESYSKEELIAEMGSAFLCGDCGILEKTFKNSAGYLSGWIKRIKENNQILFNTTAQAEKAVNYIKTYKKTTA